MHDDPINIGRLIAISLNSVVDGPHKICGHFCVINELCKATCVQSQSGDTMIAAKSPINARFMKKLARGPSQRVQEQVE